MGDPQLQILWEGCDGSTWNLLDPFSPVRVTALAGLGLPGFTQQFSETAALAGRRYEATSWNQNTVQMTVSLGDDYIPAGMNSRRRYESWRQQIDAPWRRSLSAESTGRLVVITGVGRRQLELRLNAPASPPADRNPAAVGFASYSYELTADDEPWWTGQEVSETFAWNNVTQPFFGGSAGTTLLYISRASALTSAAIANPGDRGAWARWSARGPFSSLRVGVGEQVIPLPFALDADQTVHIDSLAQTIIDGQGGNLWPLMGYVNPTWAPIPAGESVPLRIEMDGAAAGASVGVALTPRFDGPW